MQSLILHLLDVFLPIFPEKIGEIRKERKNIQEEAKQFCIVNHEEKDYLPLVQAAAGLEEPKYDRQIVAEYLKCSPAKQKEILRQAGIEEIIVSQAKIDAALKALLEDMQKYRFGRDFLYDNAKYLHRALENYASEPVENCNPHVFKDFSSADQNEAMRFIIESPKTLGFYMKQYIHPGSYKADKSAMKPPVDMVWHMFNLGNCNENVLTFWVMRIIIDSCHVFHPHSVEVGFEEYQIQTQEDMYYYTLLTLCKAYAETSK